MKHIVSCTILWIAMPLVASASDGIKLSLRKVNGKIAGEQWIELFFRNSSQAPIELEIPVEGSGYCDRYFEVEAVTKEGTPAKRVMMYAPALEPYTVRLRPNGVYAHQIQPHAYLNNIQVETFEKLRVRYANPLTKTKVLSEWLILTPTNNDIPKGK